MPALKSVGRPGANRGDTAKRGAGLDGAMRVLLVTLAVLSSGCFFFEGAPCKIDPKPWKTCSYGLSAVGATTTFGNASWDRDLARGALVALGFAPTSSSTDVAATEANAAGERIWVTARGDAIEWTAEFQPRGDEAGMGYTREQAEGLAARMENASRERAESLLAGFERETGWTRAAPLAWDARIMVF